MERRGDGSHAGGKPSWREALGSVLSAFMGVQSNARRERDFNRASPLRFIVVGVLLTATFVSTLIVVVHLIVALAGD